MGFASWQRYYTASSSERQPNFAALNRGRHLCSAGRPSRWALAHILVSQWFTADFTCHSLSLHCTAAGRPSASERIKHESIVLFYCFITFCVSRRRREMYCSHPRLCGCQSVCLYVCLRPHAYTIARIRMQLGRVVVAAP